MNPRFPACASWLLAGFAFTLPAFAQDQARWMISAGVSPVQPKPNNHPSLRVNDGVAMTVSGAYRFAPRWGVELVGALPVEHKIRLDGAGAVATVKHVPSTVSLQYHFLPPTLAADAYVGVGLNYTDFFRESTRGALAGAALRLDSSLGAAAQVGFDMRMGNRWFVGLAARWFDIDSKVALNGASLGTLQIDPYAAGIVVGRRVR